MNVSIRNTIKVKLDGVVSRGIKAAEIDENGHLIFTLTDNKVVDMGNVVGQAGTSDHAQLTNRDAANQHTIFSITNLQQTLNGKQPVITDIDTIRSNAASGAQTPAVAARVTAIETVIPDQAGEDNKLADKAFVNSTLQTSTANFRGNWSTWADVPSDASAYPTDYLGIKTPSVNDYLVVVDASDYSASDPIDGTWRFKYSGVWATDGKTGWHKEYQVNESPLTAAQLAALNSGATAARLLTIETAIDNTELWTFTLDDDTVVTKRVVVKSEP